MKKTSMLLTITVLAPMFTLAVTPFITTMLTHNGGMVATNDGGARTGPASAVVRVAVAPAASEAASPKTSWFELDSDSSAFLSPMAAEFARAETLTAHAAAAELRREDKDA